MGGQALEGGGRDAEKGKCHTFDIPWEMVTRQAMLRKIEIKTSTHKIHTTGQKRNVIVVHYLAGKLAIFTCYSNLNTSY